jgi:hypothetical protein
MYEFCHALGSDGGCLYLADCQTHITDCFFFHGVARNGGSVCVSGGKLTVVDTNFVKNSAKQKCGGLLAKDCDLDLSKTRFVGNQAGRSGGAFLTQGVSVRLLLVVFYGNTAPNCGGAELIETSGSFVECYFKDNTATEKEGTSLSIRGNVEWLCIENTKFYDTEKYPVSVSATSATRLVELQFAGQPENGIFIVKDCDRQVAVIVHPSYLGSSIEPPPELPPGMLREVLGYKETEPPFAWRSLYLLIALFTVIISMLVIFIPIVILPSEVNLGYEKQSVQVTMQGEEV